MASPFGSFGLPILGFIFCIQNVLQGNAYILYTISQAVLKQAGLSVLVTPTAPVTSEFNHRSHILDDATKG